MEKNPPVRIITEFQVTGYVDKMGNIIVVCPSMGNGREKQGDPPHTGEKK
jgi:hypothetical protein